MSRSSTLSGASPTAAALRVLVVREGAGLGRDAAPLGLLGAEVFLTGLSTVTSIGGSS
ncbi:MAG: hypothetical protein ACTSSR_00905 [Alphaproteobacteria bacterium]